MSNIIVVAGATGHLGGKITDALLAKGAEVRAIVRHTTDSNKIKSLEQKGVKVFKADASDMHSIAAHCIGASCVASALAGLRDTVVDTQRIFLDAAVQAQVPRFIPSDYSCDFTNLVPGQNRNLDWRREFHQYLEQAPIKATSILNGAFMELLTGDMPLIMLKQKRILCWGNPQQIMEFTTTNNIAAFTAEAALDNSTPRYLRIAGDKLSCTNFVTLMIELSGKQFKLFRPGGIGLLNAAIKMTRFFSPGKSELYPAWQGMQYMRDMMEGRIIFYEYDNGRYPDVQWTSVKDYLTQENVG